MIVELKPLGVVSRHAIASESPRVARDAGGDRDADEELRNHHGNNSRKFRIRVTVLAKAKVVVAAVICPYS